MVDLSSIARGHRPCFGPAEKVTCIECFPTVLQRGLVAAGFKQNTVIVFNVGAPRLRHGCAKALQVSWCLCFFGVDPSWAAKRFRLKKVLEGSPSFHQRFHQLRKFRDLSGLLRKAPHHFIFKLVYERFFPTTLALGSSAIKKVSGKMTRLFCGVLCSKGLSPPKRLLVFSECSSKSSLRWSRRLLRFFWATGCCFRKSSVEGSANYSLHLSPTWMLLHKSSLEGSADCALH